MRNGFFQRYEYFISDFKVTYLCRISYSSAASVLLVPTAQCPHYKNRHQSHASKASLI